MSTSPKKKTRGNGRLSLKGNVGVKRPSTNSKAKPGSSHHSIISLFKKQEMSQITKPPDPIDSDDSDDVQVIEEPSPTKSPYFAGKSKTLLSGEKLKSLRNKSKNLFASAEKVIDLPPSLKFVPEKIGTHETQIIKDKGNVEKGEVDVAVEVIENTKEDKKIQAGGKPDVTSSEAHVTSLAELSPRKLDEESTNDGTYKRKNSRSLGDLHQKKRLKLDKKRKSDTTSSKTNLPSDIDTGEILGVDVRTKLLVDEKSGKEPVLLKTDTEIYAMDPKQEPVNKTSVDSVDSRSSKASTSGVESLAVDKGVETENVGAKGEGGTVTEQGEEETEKNEYRIPYYLEYFHVILQSVMADEYYTRLFNEDDFSTINKFQELPDPGQKLYIRLFQRKMRWLRASQIDYPKIAADLKPVLGQLVENGMLHDESSLSNLEDMLVTLPAGDLRSLAKSLRLSTSEQRPAIIEAVQKHAKQKSIGAFFSGKCAGTNEVSVMKRGRSLLGRCYRVDKEKRWVFLRVMMLFSLHNITGEEDETTNTQLFQMLMNNIGQMKYPEYKIHRVAEIFRHREDLLSFCSAVQLEADIREAVEGNHIDEALEIYERVKPMMDSVLKDKAFTKHVKTLPEHLRWYTRGAVYTRVLTQGVEALQKKRDYLRAVSQLEGLIKQSLYHTDYRGRWYDRLALNVHTHLKQPEKALSIIRRGLSDPCVRVGHRYSIWQRAQKICTTPATQKLHHNWTDFKDDFMSSVRESPKVTIEGKQISVPGAMTRWCTDETYSDGTGEVTFIKNVEDVALRHYAQNGYPQGLHGEAGTVSIFFTLFMWDVLFYDISDAFINPYQTTPLDLYTDNFYASRQELADARIAWIRGATDQELEEEFSLKWTEKEETICIGVKWDRFEDLQHAQGLLKCVGGKVLAAIFERMVKCLRFTRSGFPDLIVWNPETQKFKVVEVKGPGDRLSTKQILWLDFLVTHGVDAEVCYVTAVGAKRLKTSR